MKLEIYNGFIELLYEPHHQERGSDCANTSNQRTNLIKKNLFLNDLELTPVAIFLITVGNNSGVIV